MFDDNYTDRGLIIYFFLIYGNKSTDCQYIFTNISVEHLCNSLLHYGLDEENLSEFVFYILLN